MSQSTCKVTQQHLNVMYKYDVVVDDDNHEENEARHVIKQQTRQLSLSHQINRTAISLLLLLLLLLLSIENLLQSSYAQFGAGLRLG